MKRLDTPKKRKETLWFPKMLWYQSLKLVKTLALTHGGMCVWTRCAWERARGLSYSAANGIIGKDQRIGCNRQFSSLSKSFEGNGVFQSPIVSHRRTVSLSSCVPASAVSTPQPGWYESFADSVPVQLTQDLLTNVQQVTGLPWWASIICTTLALRATVTFPLAIYQMYIIAKVENLQPEIAELAKRLRYEVSVRAKQVGWSEKVARFHFRKNLHRIISELYVRDNCHPFKASLLIWIQLPLWILISIALRNLSLSASDTASAPAVQDLAMGGVLWFPDLTLPDSTWILPISLGLVNLLIVEIFAIRRIELSKFQKYATYVIRGISVLMVPIAATVPSSMALYWLTSSCVGLGQNLLLRSPSLRTVCRIPKMKSDSDTPFRDLSAGLIAKYFPRK
ncbi:cytochrome c oxidase assembly protein COX18, mitochondrial isoform X1 [Chiloscyllium plagiosum]|uniref:cytochrome c oxidase assembly protein COX18, mitochondrial isoform X1 n=1 Tax=Chiloscyllium plagiosum TaxID=36176 RepID=UPI001CB868CB|nr:cytochrome c oxidase assembly protein COX18, mitochondrial isoform X1 [Chiloscyllium plagiosum]XP_043557754.1 cytochrome c oxidase assembly protein COX18, mitochondrial isoform X1 [Chiloscyllium plagiosum]XP_043557755.1 cytochrome c oxidase assembly protein COX18, mitochondrial isoform X1 [Chiloscyllium plagiosum]XP_043557756.1 cytochrome c oxidase assembly protein COX18, mitochondrial isoform X1 [Chiloscyllium plagiosum]XP_043557757.1 cytochrome c oxidase assembly protein COX18, mitochondri